ncbi:MAG TPA: type VI secretion system Vgr family protein [Luteibacter sp.]|uniref:type VI secretion system Vgr family protein n=1 Tax=Luteibacter sp. TaxID=1886636 RepID=UPI002CFD4B5C|nr:type VI secretion system Vgr family protein [Luteibacter sp.]HVI55660.1 type VI secretion system Vgr family protein [Luteibacter sp.]
MGTIPNIKEHFASEMNDQRRMLAVDFGGWSAETRPPERSFLPCRLELTESLSTPFRAVVHGLTPDFWRYPHVDVPGDRDVEPHPDRFLGLATRITIRAEGRVHLVHGVVMRARHLGNWFSESERVGYDAFELVVEAPLNLLDLRRASRVYQERTTLQILHELLEEHRLHNHVVAKTLRATFPNQRYDGYLTRACRTQYQESDLDFIQRLLIGEGLNYVLEAEAGSNGFGNAWHVFGADHDFGKTHDAILNTTPGRGELELLNWYGHRQMVPAYTHAVSHDYKDNTHYEGTARGRDNIGVGAIARGAFGSYESLSPRAVKTPSSEMDVPASHRQWAHDMEAEVYDGETTAPLGLAKPIRVLGLETARTPLRTSEEANERDDDYIVTAQTVIATAPLHAEMRQRWASLATDVRRRAGVELFQADDDETRPLRVTFKAHPRRSRIVPPHPRHARRPLPGAMTATVVGGEGAVVETDELGRIAVVFHWERAPDVPQFAVNFPTFPRPPTRVRYVHPGAGQGVGMQYLPRVGDEVLILFIDNDPDRPIAVGSVHNGELGTPRFGGVASLPKDSALTGLRTGEHKGGGANELVFDDTTGEVGVRLGSSTSATDLNLGHIAAARQGGEAAPRGTGAELRTNGSAAIRAAQGMLLTTYGRSQNQGAQLDHQELDTLLASCFDLFRGLGESAGRAHGRSHDLRSRDAVTEALDSWKSNGEPSARSPVVAVAAVGGLLAATPDAALVYAGSNIDMVAAAHVQLCSGAETSITAATGLAFDSQSGGIRAASEQGSIGIHAKNDSIRAEAKQEIRLIAELDTLSLQGKTIRLIAQDGSYVTIGDGGVEIGSEGHLVIKTSKIHHRGPSKLSPEKLGDHESESTPLLQRYNWLSHDEGEHR